MQIIQFNVIAEIPFDFSQKYQTVPRPNRRATVYFGTQLISVGCILLKNLNVGPANRPAFCRQVPLFYAKCPSKNILQVGRSDSRKARVSRKGEIESKCGKDRGVVTMEESNS